MSIILASTDNYLKTTENIKMAHLVALELPGSEGAYVYFTDYFRDIIYDSNVYITDSVKNIGTVRQTKDLQVPQLSIQISGALERELDRALTSESFLNRRIRVHRVYLDDNGDVIPFLEDGSSMLYFEGNITSTDIKDSIGTSGTGKSVITWNCASKLRDFETVNGRITDDESHRGLVNINGVMTPSGAAKYPEYQLDKGFLHANKSIKILAQYQTKEKRYMMKTRRAGGFRGMMGQKHYDMVEYWADVVKEVDMDINLTAKYIPVLYGVQKTAGIPIFMDTDKDNPDEIWAVYAFCEGEIESFLDIYFDDKPIICVDGADNDQRACIGRKRERGDTIASLDSNPLPNGVTRQDTKYTYDDGNGPIEFWLYHGSKAQQASTPLIDMAKKGQFKLQADAGDGAEYWDSSFRLIDTAYMVVKFTLTENRSSIPTVEAEIKGRKIPVYDVDHNHTTTGTSLNFAWQTLDYLTNTSFGAGINIKDIDIDAIIECASIMDTFDTSYDPSWVPFWKYLGWSTSGTGLLDIEHRQIIQGSAFINTSSTVFKNVQLLLNHFEASLNIVNGKYTITMEANRPSIADINYSDMLKGSLQVQDKTLEQKFNSVQAAIMDPAQGWSTNTITFFNRDFKAQDNGVDKKSNVTFPFITNYYTARTRAEYILNKSRYSKYATFELPFNFFWLYPNANITLTVPRYNWDLRQFVIQDVVWSNRGTVRVTAKEYSDEIFLTSPQTDSGAEQGGIILLDVLPPTELRYTPFNSINPDSIFRHEAGLNGVLSWAQSATPNISYYAIQRTGAVGVRTVPMTGAEPRDQRVELPIIDLDEGDYTFEVRAVTRTGDSSFPTKLTVKIDANKILSVVPNFRVLNLSRADENVFVGPAVELAWDPIPGADKVPDLQYKLQFLDTQDVLVRSLTLGKDINKYDYTREMNKADYKAQLNKLGIHRELKIRIQAVGAHGSTSTDWAYI